MSIDRVIETRSDFESTVCGVVGRYLCMVIEIWGRSKRSDVQCRNMCFGQRAFQRSLCDSNSTVQCNDHRVLPKSLHLNKINEEPKGSTFATPLGVKGVDSEKE